MKKTKSSSRRVFLKQISAISAAAVLPGWSIAQISSNNPLPRKVGANEKVNLACIGIGNQGGEIIKAFNQTGLCNIVALCDTDMGARHTLAIMNLFPEAPRFQS